MKLKKKKKRKIIQKITLERKENEKDRERERKAIKRQLSNKTLVCLHYPIRSFIVQ